MPDHGTIRRQDLCEVEQTTNECPKKDKHLCLLTLRVKILYQASDLVKRRGHEHDSGAAERVYQSRYPPHLTPPYA